MMQFSTGVAGSGTADVSEASQELKWYVWRSVYCDTAGVVRVDSSGSLSRTKEQESTGRLASPNEGGRKVPYYVHKATRASTADAMYCGQVGVPFRSHWWYRDVLPASGRANYATLGRVFGVGITILYGRAWLGYAGNVLIYTSVLWACCASACRVRRAMRIRHGRCEVCGYPLCGLPVCPECGNCTQAA